MASKDEEQKEIERINKKKVEELLAEREKKLKIQSQHAHGSSPITLTDGNFSSELTTHDLVVVDFWAAWCGPCRTVAPIVEELSKEYQGKVVFGKLNVDENPLISQNFGIQSIPTMLVFYKGKPVDGVLGAVPKSSIEARFKPYLKGAPPPSTLYG